MNHLRTTYVGSSQTLLCIRVTWRALKNPTPRSYPILIQSQCWGGRAGAEDSLEDISADCSVQKSLRALGLCIRCVDLGSSSAQVYVTFTSILTWPLQGGCFSAFSGLWVVKSWRTGHREIKHGKILKVVAKEFWNVRKKAYLEKYYDNF